MQNKNIYRQKLKINDHKSKISMVNQKPAHTAWSALAITRTCIEILLVLRALSLVYASVESQTFHQARGWTLTGVWLWTDTDVRSPVQCISVCGLTGDCYAVGFSKFHKNCSYYHWFSGSTPLKAILGQDNERVIPVKPIQSTYLFCYYLF